MPQSRSLLVGHRDLPLPLAPARPAACRASRSPARSSRATRSRSTLGANGRKPSRNLILMFICACICGLRGSPRMLREPSARGPNSIRPSNQPTIFSSARGARRRGSSSSSPVEPLVHGARRSEDSLDLVRAEAGPEVGALHGSRLPGATVRGCLQCRCQMSCATPERAAGVARRGLDPESLEGPLAQEPAVPDAVQRDAARQAQVRRGRSPGARCAPSAA